MKIQVTTMTQKAIKAGERYYGLSLSFCVQEILSGDMKIDQVIKLYPTALLTPDSLDGIIERYRHSYWSEWSVEEIKAVIEQLDIHPEQSCIPPCVRWVAESEFVLEEIQGRCAEKECEQGFPLAKEGEGVTCRRCIPYLDE